MVAAIVLAAGKSERMGQPKALLPFRGRTFLENILQAISQSSTEAIFAVTGHHRQEIQASVGAVYDRPGGRRPPLQFAFNDQYEKGMITSIQAGIRALPSGVDGAMLFLVDHPIVETKTIEALLSKLRPGHIILPTFQRRRGHPVLFSAEILQEILALSSSEGANIVVRKDPNRIIEVPLNSPGILVDIDTPEHYKKLLEDEEK